MGRSLILLIAVAVSGCATLPDVTYSYYPTKWRTQVMMTQAVGCNASGSRIVVRTLPSVTTTYSSDIGQDPLKIKIKSIEGWAGPFADSDVTMALTEDGRLKGINQGTTGQGEAIVKAAVTLAAAAAVALEVGLTGVPECKTVASWGGGKPVTLTYTATIDSSSIGTDVPVPPATESEHLHELLKQALPALSVKVSPLTEIKPPASYDSGAWETAVLLEMQKTAYAVLQFLGAGGKAGGGLIADARIVFPLACTGGDRDCSYKLPIPRAALFGTQKFTLVLADSGAVTSIGYTKGSAAAGVLNAANAVLATQTPAAKAAELKAEADLIAQQQRLVLCETKPAECK